MVNYPNIKPNICIILQKQSIKATKHEAKWSHVIDNLGALPIEMLNMIQIYKF